MGDDTPMEGPLIFYAMNTDLLFATHDPDFYGEMGDEVFTFYLGSPQCEKLNKEEKRAVMKLYAELDRFFNAESVKQINEESKAA